MLKDRRKDKRRAGAKTREEERINMSRKDGRRDVEVDDEA